MGRKRNETTLEERKIVIRLHEEGKSYRNISEILKRSRSTVHSIINKYKKEGTLRNKERTGRPRKLTTREERKIVRIIKQKPDTSASEIASHLQEHMQKEVHPKTVRSAASGRPQSK
ncbi:hypothetical protein ANTPLA_LOCUS8944 [Anthophora plagiata]